MKVYLKKSVYIEYHLTKGKIYNILDQFIITDYDQTSIEFFKVMCDDGQIRTINKELFGSLSELRDLKINSLIDIKL